MSGRRGVTLVELLVALVVSGMVVMAAHAALATMADAWGRSAEVRGPAMRSSAQRALLEGWLRGAVIVPSVGPFIGHAENVAAIPFDELSFATADGGPFRPGMYRVHLWIDRDPATAVRGLVAELAAIRDSTLMQPDTLEVAPEAQGMSLRYLVQDGAREDWIGDWESRTQLPRAIELRLVAISAVRLGSAEVAAQDLPPLLALPLVVPVDLEHR